MSDKESRRKFLKAVPAAVAGAVATKVSRPGTRRTPAGPIKPEMIDCAEGRRHRDAVGDEAAIAGSLNQRLRTFDQLRQIAIGPEIDPAIMFKPSLPGKEPKGPARPARSSSTKPPMTLKRPDNLEDVAFWPVTRLAALVERKLVTSTELTQMYLARLKKYQPTLNFYVTLTEDLALQQAADADREIKAGKYRGPLHGLPWGAKDLSRRKHQDNLGRRTVRQSGVRLRLHGRRTSARRARCSSPSSLGALAQGDQWFGGRTNSPWNPSAGRADRRPDRSATSAVASRSRSAPRRVARSSRPPASTASSVSVRRTAASAATARWACRTRWTKSDRCAGTSKTACWC